MVSCNISLAILGGVMLLLSVIRVVQKCARRELKEKVDSSETTRE